MDLNKLIKLLKKNESNVSMIFGVLVILIVGYFIINNNKQFDSGEIIPAIGTEEEQDFGNFYVVQSGDDLWNISERVLGSGYYWQKLAEANSLDAPYVIEEGQKLVIPNTSSDSVSSNEDSTEMLIDSPEPTISSDEKQTTEQQFENTDTADVEVNHSIKTNSYEVVRGDCLWDIAVRAYGDGYRWVDIASANNLVNPDLIHPGNKFVIPR